MDSYADGLSGVWVVVADAINDEATGVMDDGDIRRMALAVVSAYRDYADAPTSDLQEAEAS